MSRFFLDGGDGQQGFLFFFFNGGDRFWFLEMNNMVNVHDE